MRPSFAKNSTDGRRPAAGPMAGVRRRPTKASVAAPIRSVFGTRSASMPASTQKSANVLGRAHVRAEEKVGHDTESPGGPCGKRASPCCEQYGDEARAPED